MKKETDNGPDFEEALAELEALVEKMESGELKLDDSLKHFRRGVELTRLCQQVLDQAQQTVEELMVPENEASTAGGQDLG